MQLTLDFNPAIVLLDNTGDCGEPHASAFALFLGRVKRLKNPGECIGVHAAAGVLYG